jgi:hypothetical protein
MFILGLLGVILMIIENELTFRNINHKQTIVSFVIKIIISITTIILVGFVFYYNHLNNHWRVGITQKKIFLIFLEAFICLIHPIPFISNVESNNLTITQSIPLSYIDIDVALGLLSK